MFRALGVFVDGFDLDAVAAVTGLDRRGATGHIETLQAKSLVVRADNRKATRFRLLETVKAYAEDRLLDTGEAETTRDHHLAHFHTLAISQGRKVAGSLDVGLRLRHDCSNITTAFEWAADHDRWITAGELLIGSQCAYHLDPRMTEKAAALERTVAHTAALDADLHGCVSYQRFYLAIVLLDFTSAVEQAQEMTRSPLSEFRSLGWAVTAFMSAFVQPGSAAGFLTRAENELRTATRSIALCSDAHEFAAIIPVLVDQTEAFSRGDFASARDSSRELVRSFPDKLAG